MQVSIYGLLIVGVAHHGAQTLWDAYKGGTLGTLIGSHSPDAIPLMFRPEPTNINDPQALEIVVPASLTQLPQDLKLGYVTRQHAPQISALLKASWHVGATLNITSMTDAAIATTWRGRLETDNTAMAGSFLKEKGQAPDPSWHNQVVGAPAPKPAHKVRPRSKFRFEHSWM